MLDAISILFGAATCWALGLLLLECFELPLYRQERHLFAFILGSAGLSLLVFLTALVGWVHWLSFLIIGVAAIGGMLVRRPHRSEADRSGADEFPPLPRAGTWFFGGVFAIYGTLHFFHAMAPEASPDGSAYHLELVGRYFRDGGFPGITTNIYANLSQGLEMLFLVAYTFGRHSAAALVHFAFLCTLPLSMLCFARRFGFPEAGVFAALLVFLSPLVGIDGTSAYNDIAAASVLFHVVYLLCVWERKVWEHDTGRRLLAAIGLLAGFGYAVKYTAAVGLLYALGFVTWKLYRRRTEWIRGVAVVSVFAAVLIVPWMAKNWITVGNPVSPFLNRLFPNPYVHASFERLYVEGLQRWEGVESAWDAPWQLTIEGDPKGVLGPLLLLAPISLLGLGNPMARRLLLAAVVFALPLLGNSNPRFLIPALPFVALAMGLGLTRWTAVMPVVVVVHAVLSWPAVVPLYTAPHTWRLPEAIPWRAALRLEPEQHYLQKHLGGYAITRMIEATVPEGERVFAFNAPPQAYSSREMLVAYQSAFGHGIRELLWVPILEPIQPRRQFTFRFSSRKLRKVRVLQTGTDARTPWSVGEVRIFAGGQELRRRDTWRLMAEPNPWEVELAFDNLAVTRWRSWRRMAPGMFLEIAFGGAEEIDGVVVECSDDQDAVRLAVEGTTDGKTWQRLADGAGEARIAPPPDLRRAAAEELRKHGLRYLLVRKSEYGAADYHGHAAEWGFRLVGESEDARLYRLTTEPRR